MNDLRSSISEEQKSQRVAKVISSLGFCSRREAERLILSGEVKVNGDVISECVTFVSNNDVIEVCGVEISKGSKQTKLWAYYKPIGVVTTHNDPQNRMTVISEVLPQINERHIITIGRLDINSEGLLLLTNDGKLAQEFMLPKNGMLRKYKVRALGKFDLDKILIAAQNGLRIDGIYYKPFEIKLLKFGANSWFEISIFEGKNREIRKIFESFGMQVNRLIRTQYGRYTLGDLLPNQVKELALYDI